MAGIGPSLSGVSWGLPSALVQQTVLATHALAATHAAPLALSSVPFHQSDNPAPLQLAAAAPGKVFRDPSKGKMSNHGSGAGGENVSKTCGPCSKAQGKHVAKAGHSKACPYCLKCWGSDKSKPVRKSACQIPYRNR